MHERGETGFRKLAFRDVIRNPDDAVNVPGIVANRKGAIMNPAVRAIRSHNAIDLVILA